MASGDTALPVCISEAVVVAKNVSRIVLPLKRNGENVPADTRVGNSVG